MRTSNKSETGVPSKPHELGSVRAVAGIAIIASTLYPSAADAASKPTLPSANRVAAALTQRIHDHESIGLNADNQLVWTPRSSKYRFAFATDVEIKKDGYYFELDQTGKSLGSVEVKPIPEGAYKLSIPSPIVTEDRSPTVLAQTKEAVVYLNTEHRPTATVKLTNGQEVVTPVGMTRTLDQNVITY